MSFFHEWPIASVKSAMVHSARDWASSSEDAWLYGVIVGWDDEEAPDVSKELAQKFGWSEESVERLRRLHEKMQKLDALEGEDLEELQARPERPKCPDCGNKWLHSDGGSPPRHYCSSASCKKYLTSFGQEKR